MDYLTLSVAYTGFKAVSAVVSNFQKLKKLSGLPLEIQEDTFYLIHTVESIKPALELAILLHSRQLTAIHVSSSISLARKVMVECDAFIESISFIKDGYDSFDEYETDNDDNDDDDDDEDEEYQKELEEKAKNRQEIIEYLSAPSQRDRLALLLRRLQLVLQALNLGITSASFLFPKQITIYQFPFKFEYSSFQIALDIIRKMEMNREFNTRNKREIWCLTGNLHSFIIPSTKKNEIIICDEPILTRLCHTKCVLSLEQKKRKLDGKSVYGAFMTLYNIEQQQDMNENDEEKNDTNFMNQEYHKMELDFLEYVNFKRFDPIYTKQLNENEMVYDEDEDVRNTSLCYQWIYNKHKYVLEFEPLDKFNLKNISKPISCEVFEFLISLLIIRSTYLESNSKKKNVINNPSILDQFVSVKDMINLSKKYLRFNATKKDKNVTPNQKCNFSRNNGNVDDLVENFNTKFSMK